MATIGHDNNFFFVMAMIGHGQCCFHFTFFFSYGSDRPWTILILFYFDFFKIVFNCFYNDFKGIYFWFRSRLFSFLKSFCFHLVLKIIYFSSKITSIKYYFDEKTIKTLKKKQRKKKIKHIFKREMLRQWVFFYGSPRPP